MSASTETQSTEVDVLRKANAELSDKAKARKAKITELETTIAELQGKLAAAEASLKAATIDVPLRKLAETISPVPDLWLAQFAKTYSLRDENGTLIVLDAKGKPVLTPDKKPVEFSPLSVAKLVTENDSEGSEVFRHITRINFSSGSGASGSSSAHPMAILHGSQKPKSDAPNVQFGLR